MEDANLDKLQSVIKSIEKKKLELESYLSNFKLLSRTNILKEITEDILISNVLIKDLQKETDIPSTSAQDAKIDVKKDFAQEIILKIKQDPTKKVLILHRFLNLLQNISENDVNVILKSLKEKNDVDLLSELSNLITIFKLKNNS